MLEVGDRVFHRGRNINGIVRVVRGDHRDGTGVEFFRDKEQEGLHNLDGEIERDLGLWCSENRLVPTPKPVSHRRISLLGNRSMERFYRLICELPRRRRGDGSDLIINYGKWDHQVPHRIPMVNRTQLSNKYRQCTKFVDFGVAVPLISRSYRDGFIQKPNNSFAGRGIYEGSNINTNLSGVYYQQKIDKIKEFRAHVFLWGDEQVPVIHEKVVPNPEQLCWNLHQGGEFKVAYSSMLGIREISTGLVDKIKLESIKATQAIDYDFGGVDLLMDANGNVWVVEVNSRMGVKERTMAHYKVKFWELYNENLNRFRR